MKSYKIIDQFWDSAKDKILYQDINDLFLPVLLTEFVRLTLSYDDRNKLYECWKENSKLFQKKLALILSVLIERLPTQKDFLEDVETAEEYTQLYKIITDNNLDVIINNCLTKTYFRSSKESFLFLEKESMLIPMAQSIRDLFSQIDINEWIATFYDLLFYAGKSDNDYEVCRDWNEDQDTAIFELWYRKKLQGQKHSQFADMAMVFRPSEGYARCIFRNGQLGYIRVDTMQVIPLDKSIVRSYDFHCGLARFETEADWDGFCNYSSAFGYLDTRLNVAIKPIYCEAQDFCNGLALVQNEYTISSYRITINGETFEDDKQKKYKEEQKAHEVDEYIQKESEREYNKKYKRYTKVVDEEGRIMAALKNGEGDSFGFN